VPVGEGVSAAAVRPAAPASGRFDALASDAAAEGRRFVARMASEWRSGANRFDRPPGGARRGVFNDGGLVAAGGLDAGPYLPDDPGTGRLQHLYVRPAWRRAGSGALLIRHLLGLAGPRFRRVRLRTGNPGAAQLYERCGFVPVIEPDATHAFVVAR
jgi:GNAT superfamily N-acetyltransferase